MAQQTLTRAQEFEKKAAEEKGTAAAAEVRAQKAYEDLPNTQAVMDQATARHETETTGWQNQQNLMRGEFDRAQKSLQEALSASQTGDLTALSGELAVNTGKIKALDENTEGLREKLSVLTGRRGATTGQLTAISGKIKELEGKETGDCLRCGQPIDSSHIEQELKDLKASKKDFEQHLIPMVEEDEYLQKALNQLGLDRNAADKEKTRIQNSISVDDLITKCENNPIPG